MDELTIHTLRSRTVGGSELVSFLDRFQSRFSPIAEEYHRSSKAGIATYSLRPKCLPTLDSFVNGSIDAMLLTGTRDTQCVDAFLSMTRLTHASSMNHSWTTQYMSHSDRAMKRRKADLDVSSGLRREGYFCGVYAFRPSPAIGDLLLRAALFQTAVEEMGLAKQITVFMDGEVLRMKAQEPWKLAYPSARFDGANPLGFYACGFSGVEEALGAGERLVKRFAKKLVGVGFSASLTHAGYDAAYQRLNELWQGWDVTFLGSLTTKALDILHGGELPPNPPERIPAFHGYLADDGQGFYGSVVIDSGQRYLEIATDNAPLEMLQEWADFVPDADFKPVVP